MVSNCGFTLHVLMTNELAGFFMCLLGPFFEDACQLPNVILGSWEANLSPENTLISFPPGTVHVSFSFSKSSPNTQTRLRAAWADPLSPRRLIVRCSDPPEYPRPAGNLAGLQLQRFGHGEPAGSSLLSACPRLRFGRGARLVTPGPRAFSEPNNGGYAVCRTLGAPLPSVLEETLCTVIRHHPRRVSPSGRGSALAQILSQKDGDSGPVDPQGATRVLDNQQQRRTGNACIRQRVTEHLLCVGTAVC